MKKPATHIDSAWPVPEAGVSPLKVRGQGLPFAVKDGNNSKLSGLIDLSATRSIFAFSR